MSLEAFHLFITSTGFRQIRCNKDLLVPNLLLKSMVALRRVYDSIRGQNPATIEVTKEMIDYVRRSRADYIAKEAKKLMKLMLNRIC